MISRFLTMGWTHKGRSITELSDMPEGTFGFIYKITNGITGEFYIGKKQVVSIRKRKFGKKETAALTDKRMKKYEMVTKESDWLNYRSSNKVVKSFHNTISVGPSKSSTVYLSFPSNLLESIIVPS